MRYPILLAVVLSATLLSSCGISKWLHPAKTVRNSRQAPSPASSDSGIRSTAEAYIERFKFIAVEEMQATGIPASITLAQGLLESGNGTSELAVKANNHFGIKCAGEWTGKTIFKDDDEKDECFRVYRTPEESYRDHSEFLKRKRYAPLFELRKDDYRAWAYGLKDAGYATNPKYPELLISLIERHNLQVFDEIERPADRIRREEGVAVAATPKQEGPEEKKSEPMKAPVTMKIYEVKAGDTLYSIAKSVGLSVDELRTINSIYNERLNVGQLLVVSK